MELNVPYAEKNAAKALGAQWNPDKRCWVAPVGSQTELFARWIPGDDAGPGIAQPPRGDPGGEEARPRGVALSALMHRVTALVAEQFPEAIWVQVEVASLKRQASGLYLELTERNARGDLQAKATGVIWNRVAAGLCKRFEAATGSPLAAGMKLLVLAQPRFASRFAFSLDIHDIDPSYTLGAMQAKLMQIRAQLRAEGLFDKQKRLLMPRDFFDVLVIAPESGAGLGDFMRDAAVLERAGVCRFVILHAVFQGDRAPIEIASAIACARGPKFQARPPDAIVIIRGGGAVADMDWLNDYRLAMAICQQDIPIFTGIGHEKDSTILDEVAHTRFDTPSKVIAGIRDLIVRRAQAARDAMARIQTVADNKVAAARAGLQGNQATVQRCALQAVAQARGRAAQAAQQSVQRAHQRVTAARAHLGNSAQSVQTNAGARAQRARTLVDAQIEKARTGAQTKARLGRERALAYLREILVQGPQRVLERGFVYLRGRDGCTRTRASQLQPGEQLIATFADGRAHLCVQESIDQGDA